MKNILNKIWYYIKQLFPCLYVSTYTIGDSEILSIWRQWFGRVLWAEVFELDKELTIINSKIPPTSSIDEDIVWEFLATKTLKEESENCDENIERRSDS